MRQDPIVREIREIREKHAARFDYDLEAIFEDIKARERARGQKFVRFPARRTPGEKSAPPPLTASP